MIKEKAILRRHFSSKHPLFRASESDTGVKWQDSVYYLWWEFLRRHETRGFTLQSLCLALPSAIRFDPETGRRLPTYITGDFAALKVQAKDKKVEEGVITEELPLARVSQPG